MDLSLAIIAKDEHGQLNRIIKNYSKYFSEIVVALDDLSVIDKINVSEKVKIIPYTWIDDFSHKRNFLENYIKTDYYFRLDTDDAIINPENIQFIIDKARNDNVSIVYCYYDYAKDENGITCAAHWRETFIKKSKDLYWNKPIHENLISKSMGNHKIVMDNTIKIDHLIDFKHSMKSSMRNIKYLLKEYDRDKENTDPRTIAYLGRMLLGIEEHSKARFFLEKHIQMSGWDEDRYSSWCSLVDIHLKNKDYEMAKASAFEALAERADYPDAYLKLHDVYFQQENWTKAIDWVEMGLKKPEPKTFILRDPSASGWRPILSLSFCYFKLGDFKKALKLFKIAEKQAPNLPFIKSNKKLYEEAALQNEYMERFMWLSRVLEEGQERLKIKHLIYSVPKSLESHEIITKMKHVYLPAKTWDKKSIVIFAGSCNEEWTPDNIADGIGGSEEAIIYISKEFKKLGYDVTVYNNCGEKRGNYDGIEYEDYFRFNPADNFNIIISWRNNIFVNGVQGSRKIIWLHDIPSHIEWSKDTIKIFDKVVVLSKYHASLLPEVVPLDKIYVSSNGIVPKDFKDIKEERHPKRIIYASSYNRGLEQMLEKWSDIKKEVPEAEIHCYYGWDVYDQYVKEGAVKDVGFKSRMLNLFKQDGVYEHGRIGHKQLLREYAKAGVFAYPCTYAGEINCIALTKAIASGCNIVTNKFAVMEERSPNAVSDKDFISEMIKIVKNAQPNVLDIEYIEKHSWQEIAKQWSEDIFENEIETISYNRIGWIREQCNKETDKIIDIGCAEGHLFKDWNRERITSVDMDKHDLPNFIQGNAENLSINGKKFDVAVLGEILEHVPSPQKVLKEALRVANKVVITVPYEDEWRDTNQPFYTIEDKEKETGKTREQLLKEEGKIEFENFDNSDNYNHLWHHRFYTPETLVKELTDAGAIKFNIVKIRSNGMCNLGAVING